MRDSVPTNDLLARARAGDAQALGDLLEAARTELHRLAAFQLEGRIAGRVDASDIIQLTFLEAHRCIGQFQGTSDRAWQAWLATILEHNVANAIRDHTRLQKRDVRREQALEGDLDADQSSPSQKLIRGEEADRLRQALELLPPEQQRAVRLRHLEGRPLLEIAAEMGRSPTATAGLIKRGLQALRRQMHREGP
jgi:RNA polymerase sigma-70 factor (ECF subfamily)